MQQPITNPPVPYVGPIRGGFTPGTMVRIQGQTPPTADRFNINLHCGAPPSDVALHVSVRLLQNYIARNSMQSGGWGTEEDSGTLPIAPGQRFEIIILCDPGSYKIAVNGNHFGEFRHRIPFQEVTHLAIDEDVTLGLISFESGAPSAPPPSGDYAYGPPPGQYGPPPQGPYGPSPYGGGAPGGPPRPPGHQEESGFDNFLETAGTILAGALASGAAQNLIGGITGSGGQAQQQQYQPPPPPPPPPQQPLFPLGGQGSIGGLGSVGSLLQTFAGQVLGPKKHYMPMPTPTSVPLPNGPPPINMPMPSSVPTPQPRSMPPLNMPMPSSVPIPPSALPSGPPAYIPPLPPAPMYAAPPPPSQMPPYGAPPPVHPQMYSYGAPPSYFPPPGPMPTSTYPAPLNMQGYAPQYEYQNTDKSKMKNVMKYGLPIAGAGLAAGVGAYALSSALRPRSWSCSSSSSSCCSD